MLDLGSEVHERPGFFSTGGNFMSLDFFCHVMGPLMPILPISSSFVKKKKKKSIEVTSKLVYRMSVKLS